MWWEPGWARPTCSAGLSAPPAQAGGCHSPRKLPLQQSGGGRTDSLASALHRAPPSALWRPGLRWDASHHPSRGAEHSPPIGRHAPGHVRAPCEGQAPAHSTRGQAPEARKLGPATQARPYPGACWALALPTSRSSQTSLTPHPLPNYISNYLPTQLTPLWPEEQSKKSSGLPDLQPDSREQPCCQWSGTNPGTWLQLPVGGQQLRVSPPVSQH